MNSCMLILYSRTRPVTMMVRGCWLLVIFALMVPHTAAQEEVSKATLLDSLPDGGQLAAPCVVTVRTSFQGVVEFVDSTDFAILINASAPSMEKLGRVQYDYHYMDGDLLLQVHHNIPPEDNSSIIVIIIIVICMVCLVVFLGMLGYVVYWFKYERTTYIKKLREAQVPLVVRARKGKNENPNRIEVVVSLNSTPTKKRRPKSRPSKSSGDDAASSDGEATSSTRSAHSVKRSASYQRLKGQRSRSVSQSKLQSLESSPSNTGKEFKGEISASSKNEGIKRRENHPVAEKQRQPVRITVDKPVGQSLPEPLQAMSDSDTDMKRLSAIVSSEPDSDHSSSSISQRKTLSSDETSSSTQRSRRGVGGDELSWDSDFDYGLDGKMDDAPVSFDPDDDDDEEDDMGLFDDILLPNSQMNLADNLSNEERERALTRALSQESSEIQEGKRMDARDLYLPLMREPMRSPGTTRHTHVPPQSPSGRRPSWKSARLPIGVELKALSRSVASSTGTGSSSESVVTIVTADTPKGTPTTPVADAPWDKEQTSPETRQRNHQNELKRRFAKEQEKSNTKGPKPLRHKEHKEEMFPINGDQNHDFVNGNLSDETRLLPENGRNCGSGRSVGGGGDSRGGGPTKKRLHMTTLAVLSVLGLVTGVCCSKFQDETRVHIKVYMPAHFILKGSAVYAKIENRVELANKMEHPEINIYDVNDPYLGDIYSSKCHGTRCVDKCDVKTGSCICRRGFRPMDDGICTDTSECIELGQLCHRDAVCRNTYGGYKCVCLQGFYGDGLSCTSCLQKCPSGHYKHTACSPTQDMVCQSCTSKCKDDEYEYIPCTNLTDRVCKPKDALKPQLSLNMVYEDKNRNFGVRSRLWYLEEGQFSGAKTYALNRGQDLSIQISVNEVNLLPEFRAVRHDRNNENDAFYGDANILTQYCPHPMPKEYDLQLVLHKNVTAKAVYRNCTLSPSGGMICTGGYHMDPRQPCLTYKKFYSPPRLHPTSVGVLLCTEPSQLTDLYSISEELTVSKTIFAEPTERCATQQAACKSCINRCAESLKSAPEKCRVTGEEQDDGWSPRLRHCQNCCLQRDCTSVCGVYNDNDCQPVRCLQGNIAELVLSPIFSSRAEEFLCHIEPAPDYLYDIQYSVVQDGKVLLDRVFRAKKRINREEDLWNTVDVHPLLNVHYSTGFAVQPQVLHGNSRQGQFTVSKYQPEGLPLHGPLTSAQRLKVRPKYPWGISTKTWSQKSCDMTALDDFIPGDPFTYRHLNDISIGFIEGKRHRYRLHNTTAQPYIFFELPHNTSVMALFFPRVEILDDTSLKARLDRNATHWLIYVEGRIKRAPGFFTIKIHEDDYPDAPLFNMDIGQSDHENFKVLFPVATGSSAVASKSMTVEISGINNKVAFRLHWVGVQPVHASIQALNTKGMIEADNTEGGATDKLSKPLLIGLSAVIGFLILLLVVGSCLSEGKGIDVDSRFHTSHLMMTVMYVVFRTAYSLALTCTVFVFLWIYLNSGPLQTLKQYPSFLITVQSLQQLEVQEVNQYMVRELDKQMDSFNQTKAKCQLHMQAMQNKMIKAQKQLNAQQLDQLGSQRVSQAMHQFAQKAMEDFTATVIKSRAAYNSYVKNTVSRLLFDMKKTEENLLNIDWLTGASRIYNAVRERRSVNGETTRTFPDWLGFQERLKFLEANLTLPTMPLPNLQDFKAPVIDAATERSSIADIQEVTVPKNLWFVHSPNVSVHLKKPNSTSQELRWNPNTEGEVLNWTTFLVLILIIDCVWLIHRIARTYVTAHRLMYGTPHYIDCTEQEENEGDKPGCCKAAMEFHIRLMKTEFVPKLVGVGMVCTLVYFLLASSKVLISPSSLSSMGYFKALTLPISSVRSTAMAQIRAQSQRLNTIELPSYEKITSAHIEQYQIMLQLMEGMACQQGAEHLKGFCIGGERSDLGGQGVMGSCQTASYKTNAAFIPCDIGLVSTELGKRPVSRVSESQLVTSLQPFISAVHDIVVNTCHLLIVFVAVLVLIDLLSTVVWLYLQKFHLIQEHLVFQTVPKRRLSQVTEDE